MKADPPASIVFNIKSNIPMPGSICGTVEELKEKQEKRLEEMRAAMKAEKSWANRFWNWLCDLLVAGLVLVMAAMPFVVLACLMMFALAAVLGSLGVLVRWTLALWNWFF